jgi:hypothetical protein
MKQNIRSRKTESTPFSHVRTLIVSLSILLLAGCNSSTIRFTNGASDPFELFVDGKSCGRIPERQFINLSVEAGSHSFKVVQAEGYAVFPTEYTKNVTVEAGKNLEWSWGNMILPSN